MCTKKLIFSTKTYVVGTQKNRLNKTVLLSTQNICSNWWIRIYLQFYTQNFCLSKPMYIIWTICCSYQKLKMQKRVILNKYTKLKIEGQWSRMSILSNRLLKKYQSINQFTENDQWSMNSINRPTTSYRYWPNHQLTDNTITCINCWLCKRSIKDNQQPAGELIFAQHGLRMTCYQKQLPICAVYDNTNSGQQHNVRKEKLKSCLFQLLVMLRV